MEKTEIERRNDTKRNRIIYFKLIPTSEALATQDRGRDLPTNCNNIFSRISRIRLSRPKLKLDSHLAQAYHDEIELSACFELYQQCRRSYFLFMTLFDSMMLWVWNFRLKVSSDTKQFLNSVTHYIFLNLSTIHFFPGLNVSSLSTQREWIPLWLKQTAEKQNHCLLRHTRALRQHYDSKTFGWYPCLGWTTLNSEIQRLKI